MSRRRAGSLLVVMAKEPVPGSVKTRLCPPLAPAEAADLYRCFLQDRVAEMAGLPDVDLAVAYAPAAAAGVFASLIPASFGRFPQQGADLGERLARIFRDKLAEGYEAVSIVDSDSPDLPRSIVAQSFRTLRAGESDAVFGPCGDGGYYLVGLKSARRELFAGIPWSTERVLPASLERAAGLGLRTALLPPWDDIDTYPDLMAFYRRHRFGRGNGGVAGATLAHLRALEDSGRIASAWSTFPAARGSMIAVK